MCATLGPMRVKAGIQAGEAQEQQSFLDHFRELRRRLIVCLAAAGAGAVLAFVFYQPLVAFLYSPFEAVQARSGENLLFVHTIFEGFVVKVKVALLAGLVLSFPVLLYNALRFIFPGLKRRERKVVSIALAASFLLIGASFYYSYYQVIPFSIAFLTGSGFIPPQTGVLLNFGKNIFIIFQLLLVSIVVFQVPVALEVLLVMDVLSRRALLKASRYVVVGIFVLAAVVTPPDFVSQLSVALPLVVLFFLTILIAKIGRFGEGRR